MGNANKVVVSSTMLAHRVVGFHATSKSGPSGTVNCRQKQLLGLKLKQLRPVVVVVVVEQGMSCWDHHDRWKKKNCNWQWR